MSENVYRKQSWQQAEELPLFESVAIATGLSRHKARLAVVAGLVTVEGSVAAEPTRTVAVGSQIRADLSNGVPKHSRAHRAGGKAGRAPRVAAGARLSVLHIDRDLVVVDKPCGMASAPSERGHRGTVLDHLRKWLRAHDEDDRFLGVVHRLDQETSGCLVVARNRDAQHNLQEQFASHTAGRRYQAVVVGGPEQSQDVLTGKIGRGRDGRRAVVSEGLPGKSVETRFQVVQRWPAAALVRCELATGRTHQIRVHLSSIGCPVVGDPVYLRQSAPAWARKVNRMYLHAEDLTLAHPYARRPLTVTAPLPQAFGQLQAKLPKIPAATTSDSDEAD
jgi:23S rRNA pseudouridine1911/1915/1917 synthase